MSETPVVVVGDEAAELDFRFPARAYISQDVLFKNTDGTDYSWPGGTTGKGELRPRGDGTALILSFTTGAGSIVLTTGKMTLVNTMPATPGNYRYDVYTIDGSSRRTRRLTGQWDIEWSPTS